MFLQSQKKKSDIRLKSSERRARRSKKHREREAQLRKAELELEHKRELDRQRELERQREIERQRELEHQKELERIKYGQGLPQQNPEPMIEIRGSSQTPNGEGNAFGDTQGTQQGIFYQDQHGNVVQGGHAANYYQGSSANSKHFAQGGAQEENVFNPNQAQGFPSGNANLNVNPQSNFSPNQTGGTSQNTNLFPPNGNATNQDFNNFQPNQGLQNQSNNNNNFQPNFGTGNQFQPNQPLSDANNFQPRQGNVSGQGIHQPHSQSTGNHFQPTNNQGSNQFQPHSMSSGNQFHPNNQFSPNDGNLNVGVLEEVNAQEPVSFQDQSQKPETNKNSLREVNKRSRVEKNERFKDRSQAKYGLDSEEPQLFIDNESNEPAIPQINNEDKQFYEPQPRSQRSQRSHKSQRSQRSQRAEEEIYQQAQPEEEKPEDEGGFNFGNFMKNIGLGGNSDKKLKEGTVQKGRVKIFDSKPPEPLRSNRSNRVHRKIFFPNKFIKFTQTIFF